MAIYNPVLPSTLMEAIAGASRHVGNMVLLPSNTSADLLYDLEREALQVPIDEVVAFLQRAKSREIVLIFTDMDLVQEHPVGLVVVVGLCAVCEKEVDGVPVEFHHCPYDEVIDVMGFRSPVGPIQRPPRGTVV